MQSNDSKEKGELKPLGFLEMLQSVLAAFIGIQSQEKRESDFKRMKPVHVLVAGLMLVAIFMGTVFTIVSAILATHH